jgi:hypothetical protein
MERFYKGMKKYNSVIQLISNSNNFDILTVQEWEGCLGLAIVMSVMDGIEPDRKAISDHLEIPLWSQNFNKAYDRLKINGILSNRYNVRSDNVLKGCAQSTIYREPSEIGMNAWCIIAGISGGFIGIKEQS